MFKLRESHDPAAVLAVWIPTHSRSSLVATCQKLRWGEWHLGANEIYVVLNLWCIAKFARVYLVQYFTNSLIVQKIEAILALP